MNSTTRKLRSPHQNNFPSEILTGTHWMVKHLLKRKLSYLISILKAFISMGHIRFDSLSVSRACRFFGSTRNTLSAEGVLTGGRGGGRGRLNWTHWHRRPYSGTRTGPRRRAFERERGGNLKTPVCLGYIRRPGREGRGPAWLLSIRKLMVMNDGGDAPRAEPWIPA